MKRCKRLLSHSFSVCVVLCAVLAIPLITAAQSTSAPATQPKAKPTTPTRPIGVAVTRPGTFEIHYRDADLRGVLQQLSAQSRKNIIATKDVSGKVTADLYGVTFTEALNSVLRASGFVYEEDGNFVYVMTAKEMADRLKASRKLEVRTFRLSYITSTDARTLITPVLSNDGTAAITPAAGAGIETSGTETGGVNYASDDVLVVRDYPDNLDRVAAILKELDVKPDQVLIEATILRATLTEDNALGVDFNILSGIRFDHMGSTSPGIQSMTTGNVVGDTLNRNAATFRTDFNTAIPAGGMTIGFLSDKISMFVRALESVTDVTVLANPKLLVINKQRGEVMIGNRDGYITTTFTETTATQTVEFLETGTRLVVRPYIAKDGYVRMEIHPEDSSGDVVQVGQSALPSETTTEVTSNVLVRDGRTIVIGGLFRERTSNGRAQIPLLGNVPYLGTLFRRTIDATNREEVIVLVTPRIIKEEVDEKTTQQIKNDIERFRMGQRKGLRWWGRTRLAQRHMRWAKQELTAGRRGKALWNVDMALSLEPRMEEAIRMKERLTSKAYWSDESQYSAVKYIIERMVMQELGKPVERIIPPRKPREARKIAPKVRKAFNIGPRYEDPLPGPKRGPVKPHMQRRPIKKTKATPAPTTRPARAKG